MLANFIASFLIKLGERADLILLFYIKNIVK